MVLRFKGDVQPKKETLKEDVQPKKEIALMEVSEVCYIFPTATAHSSTLKVVTKPFFT